MTCASEHPGELGIIVPTQVSELWWTLIASELQAAQAQLRADSPGDASRTLGRAVVHFEPLNATWRSIALTTPKELLATATRGPGVIGEDTAFQSWRHHHMLCLLGGAQAEPPRSIACERHRAQVNAALAGPSVYDDVLAYFSRIGMPVPEHVLERDPRAPYVPSPAVEQVWRDIYEDPYPDATLQQLGETLVDIATALTDWKCRHLMTMRRTFVGRPVGFPADTVDALAHSMGELPFPELWSARRSIGAEIDARQD